MRTPYVCLPAAVLLASGLAVAQESADRVVVPLHDSSRPYLLKASQINGGITVRGYSGKDVIVESKSGRPSRISAPRADGMRRIEAGGTAGITIEEENNVVNIRTESWRNSSDLVIQAPFNTSLKLRCVNGGDITVEGINGEIDVNNVNGRVTLSNVSGTVLAHALNGKLLATLDRVDANKPMSFSTLNGDIDVTLPVDIKAKIKLKTDNGETYSDFDIRLDPTASKATVEDNHENGGRYRVRIDRSVTGNINGGGPELQFTSLNGQIFIRKKK
jgi:DUF4097 and DUF4098 domain-containing protein YvlB